MNVTVNKRAEATSDKDRLIEELKRNLEVILIIQIAEMKLKRSEEEKLALGMKLKEMTEKLKQNGLL